MVFGLGMVLAALAFVTWALEVPGARGYQYMLTALVAGGAIFAATLRSPLGRAVGKMIEGEDSDQQLVLRVEDLEARLAGMEQRNLSSGEVEAQFSRLSEVEERLDFAERLLTRIEPTVPERLP